VTLSRRHALQAALAFAFAPRDIASSVAQVQLPPKATEVLFERGLEVCAMARRGTWNMAAILQPGQTEDDLRDMLLEAINDDVALTAAMSRRSTSA
jgi:hypothetical protein